MYFEKHYTPVSQESQYVTINIDSNYLANNSASSSTFSLLSLDSGDGDLARFFNLPPSGGEGDKRASLEI